MAEEGLSNLVGQVHRYAEFGRRLLHRWWLIVMLTVAGLAGAVTAALLMTRIYQSRTLIVWKEGLAKNRIFSGDDSDARGENWLQPRVQQLISSHTRLWKLAQELGIFEVERRVLPAETALELIRKAIKFDMVGMDSFWIAFEYKDPVKAQQAARLLAKEFIEQNVGDKVRMALATQSFMETEVGKARSQLDELESQLGQFVADHTEFQVDPVTGMPRGSLQRTTGSRRPPVVHASLRSPELRQALARKGRLEAQLQIAPHSRGDSRLSQARIDLAAAQRLLAAKRRQYTDQHPDVQRAQRFLIQMQLQLRHAQEASQADRSAAQRLRQELAEVDRSIARGSGPRHGRSSGKDLRQRDSSTGEGLSQGALLEKRWFQLTRDREIAKARHDQLYERLTKARVTAALESSRAETQFTIVDPANLPSKPVRPSRLQLIAAGTTLGFLLGLALAGLLVILDPRIYNDDDLGRICDLPILAQIPREG